MWTDRPGDIRALRSSKVVRPTAARLKATSLLAARRGDAVVPATHCDPPPKARDEWLRSGMDLIGVIGKIERVDHICIATSWGA